ncbi:MULTISPECIES: GNAT family N-acetyltransferase [Streptomyces]|uniref:Acetyltransferase n=4 Tax=Streptomyces griseoaurantiacus TaxID=68213 RepID=F3NRD7_9ACTN|nr:MULTISPECIES: GNAT family N-acetyltransferase [Streptomyces]EGG44121.1 acetyltransferase [Streptomyces griseoaurantiacus M045]MDX3090269.1 GNAT family N-acetyltransferase [Streptomyces sp. ME12-02E]MDX3335862.1 GNAT family N-acetyltransferase [Streptomyces sp. ME02-6978a]SDF84132.1 Predicted N-acyltransferase, GNAT family [Streptomyces jietaisiensis]
MNAPAGAGRQRYEIRVAEDPADREACFAVRKEVFVLEQGVPEDIEYDAHDAGAVHVLALRREDGLPLGTGRLLYGPAAAARNGGEPSVGSLGRLAVVEEARGLGVGAALVRAIEEAARERGLTGVDLHAQTHALGFYARLGYEAYGPEFPDAGMPHRAMRRPLRDGRGGGAAGDG